jgi:hypothetical protein
MLLKGIMKDEVLFLVGIVHIFVLFCFVLFCFVLCATATKRKHLNIRRRTFGCLMQV